MKLEDITMKKIIALVLVAAILTLTLASCGGVSGKYSAELLGTGVELEFKGSKVIARFKVLGSYGDPIEGKYKVKGDEITITFPDDDKDTKDLSGTHAFEKGDGYVKIGVVTYKSVD
jgi:predicted small lipoprotein YifL